MTGRASFPGRVRAESSGDDRAREAALEALSVEFQTRFGFTRYRQVCEWCMQEALARDPDPEIEELDEGLLAPMVRQELLWPLLEEELRRQLARPASLLDRVRWFPVWWRQWTRGRM